MKRIVAVELSHQNAPLSVREGLSHCAAHTEAVINVLKQHFEEVFLLSTCNRLSIYALADSTAPLVAFFKKYDANVEAYLTIIEDEKEAIRNLFSTASGLESQAIGEHEILGQIRTAFKLAQDNNAIGSLFNELIKRALHTGKRVRKETAIGQYSVSLASVSLNILSDIYKQTSHLNWLILGTGEMATLFLKLIAKYNEGKIFIASKTLDRANTLANMYNGKAISVEDIPFYLSQVNVVIGATNADKPIITDEMVKDANLSKWISFVDLGLPRNFEASIKLIPEHKLFDLDDIKSLTEQGLKKRYEEIPKAMQIVDEEVSEFQDWYEALELKPVISEYYNQLKKIQEEELSWVLPKMGTITDAQQKMIENLVSRVTRRLSGKPIEQLKSYAKNSDKNHKIETFKEIFGLPINE